MSLKNALKVCEKRVVGSFLVRSSVLFFAKTLFRAGWLYGRLRFRAYCPNAGDAVCHWSVEIKYPERISIADGVVIGPGVTLGGHGGLQLDRNVRISKQAFIETAGLRFDGNPPYAHKSALTVLEEGVWVGAGAMILGGVRVGRNAVIGAGAVVSKDVESFAVVVGNPMATVKRYGQDESGVGCAE